MSEIDLEAIRARAEAATAGPWDWEAMRGYPQRISNPQAIVIAETYTNPDHPAHDAEFIAQAREDVPALVAEVERVRAIPEHPEMVPNAADDWQNGYRWGWYYAIKAVREASS